MIRSREQKDLHYPKLLLDNNISLWLPVKYRLPREKK